ncbi:MoaF N-terminal domain-containing protein, partial [Clostridium botulinum]
MAIENNREFPTVLELSQGFSEFRLPQSGEFIGKKLELNFEKGYKVVYDFIDFETLKCTYIEGDAEEMVASIYTLVSPRKNIYILDFIWSYGETKSITTVLDLNKNIATTLVGILPIEEEVSVSLFERGDKGLPFTSVKAEFSHAAINSEFT